MGKLDKVKGCFFGCAIGDALGFPVEFSKITPGTRLVNDLPKEVLYSDDTQMTIRTARGLINSKETKNLKKSARFVAEQYILWRKNDPRRIPGQACLHGTIELEKQGIENWRKCGKPNSAGCGAVMRSSPYGLWLNNNPQKAGIWAREHAHMTHKHLSAIASAGAFATGIACLYGNYDFDLTLKEMVKSAKKVCGKTALKLSEIHSLLSEPPEKVLTNYLGWCGDEAVIASFYCFLKFPNSFEDAVLLAVNTPGDSDSLGAITGALSGVYLGFEKIKKDWQEKIENRALIDELSGDFSKEIP